MAPLMYRMSFFTNWRGCVLEREPSLLLRILRASDEGYTESYIICPGAVVGPATGPVPAASFFFHLMSQVALGYKMAVYIEEGSNVFYMVRNPSRVSIPAPSWGNANNHNVILLGTPGRPRRPLQPRLCTHTKPRGCQGEPVREVLHRHQHADNMEARHDRVRRRSGE